MSLISKNLIPMLLQESGNTVKLYTYISHQYALSSVDWIELSQLRMSNACLLSPVTIIHALKRLKSLGIIQIQKQRRPNRPSKYRLNIKDPTPESHSLELDTKAPSVDWMSDLTLSDYQKAKEMHSTGLSQQHLRDLYGQALPAK